MKSGDLLEFLQVAATSLWLNRMRSILTTLGIIIGVASVIVMSAIGDGASATLKKQIANLGTNVLNVMPGSMRVGGRQLGFGGARPLSEKDMRALVEQVPGIAAISGQLNGNVNAVIGSANWTTTVNGVHAQFFDVRPWSLTAGRVFTADEVSAGAKVAILGTSVIKELFPSGTPVGDVVRINNIPFEIIGVLSSRGLQGGNDQDNVIIVPISTARSRLVGRLFATVPDTAGMLQARVADGYDLKEVQEQMTSIMRKRRHLAEGADDDFTIRNFSELLQTSNAQQQTLRILLGTTAFMSLVVGGIGIMNIMLVSVTERTREIGLRMAVGARDIDVLAQFLTEAVLLCLVGGVIGLVLGVTVTVLVSVFAGWSVVIGVGTMAMAILASAAVGIIFGFIPARRAAALNPIDALRYE
jgi:putative ABC transport system permease protein